MKKGPFLKYYTLKAYLFIYFFFFFLKKLISKYEYSAIKPNIYAISFLLYNEIKELNICSYKTNNFFFHPYN